MAETPAVPTPPPYPPVRAKVTERGYAVTGRPAFICDYSPPRSGRPGAALPPPERADFISVAYNPGRAARVNPVIAAADLQRRHSAAAVFTLATRNMNRLALQSLLLGAQTLELRNLIAVAGDPFPPDDDAATVSDYRTTGLIAAAAALNAGVDYRGRTLPDATDFCIGAAVDLGKGIAAEARLAARKVRAGAHFLITQPVFNPDDAAHFADALAARKVSVPVFYGVALLEPGSLAFSAIPPGIAAALDAGRSGVDLALETWAALQTAGAADCYLVPPIRPGGARNYDAADEFLRQAA